MVAVVWQECLGGLVEELSSHDYQYLDQTVAGPGR